MLYVIYGKDREKGRARFRALQKELSKKEGDIQRILESEVSDEFMVSSAQTRGLFDDTAVFTLDCILEKKDTQELLIKNGDDLVVSPNIFIVFEPGLEKASVEALKKSKAVIEEHTLPKMDTRPDFNIFSLGDALGSRNKKELWVLYQEALANDLSPEEISGTLFWAVKNLALMKDAKTGDAGLSPFVAKKTRTYVKNYTSEEIQKLSHALVTLYHEAHRGGEPMEVSLERFILSI